MSFHGRRVPVKLDLCRRRDGGLAGHWERSPLILRVSTFDPTRLRPSDFIDIPRSANLFLEVFGHQPNTSRALPWAKVSFRHADSSYTRRDTRFRGFLYYHVPLLSRPLSGGLRFRCTPAPAPASFAHGQDLLCPTGLPWTIPFPNLVRFGGRPIMQSLLRDNLASLVDVLASRKSFHERAHPDRPVVHAVGQPWFLDLHVPAMIFVPGPNKLLRCHIYPAVARYGALVVCFEHTANPDHPHELALRVLDRRSSNVSFHPTYAHLPPPVRGSLLAHPLRTFPRPWTWNYDTPQKAEMAAGLFCLVNGPGVDVRPSDRIRVSLEHTMHYSVPSPRDFAWYEGEEGEPSP
ncbi:hypothetical protein B0H17DRAFT_1060897 [Mycena rosella]|uniref:Uncharacterized protein n=1 Tax=Mycena rosella TaxID=1033263 RepID=A0AAD7DJ41_MYCRO|nr:hypothetical protein B0H17DRAFT_1060897 [Mycena rosella]